MQVKWALERHQGSRMVIAEDTAVEDPNAVDEIRMSVV